MSTSPVDLDPVASGSFTLAEVTIRLDPDDDVVIARVPVAAGSELASADRSFRVRQLIPGGHKIAIAAKTSGQPVKRYGQIIGFASQSIELGDHVHTHNLAAGSFHRGQAIGSVIRPAKTAHTSTRTFRGYRRSDGRVGTRNYVAVISSVNCSASASRYVAQRFSPDALGAFPHVDGVMAVTHKSGCCFGTDGPEREFLRRVLAGFARHPNVAAYVLIGLGCEGNQVRDLIEKAQLGDPCSLIIQEHGGLAETVGAGVEAVAKLLPLANECRRQEVPASKLMVALQCGGSDAWSGVTANPALGYASDLLVSQGGTVVLGETPEMYGAEQLLVRRAVSDEVRDKLMDRIHWWEQYVAANGVTLDNNPSPGNKVGGLTTIYEKSLGAVAKSGTTPLTDVVGYAEPVCSRGLVHMDTPGYDPVSVTGQVAGGCTLVAFTTGRGSVFGCRPSPTIKIATTSGLAARMPGDMDVDAGRILSGTSVGDVGREIFELMLAAASGQHTKSESHGIGEEEFNPWIIGATL
jgi:altronate hydrolase